MIDINLIREHAETVRQALASRQLESSPVDQALDLDRQRRELIQQVETLKAERNAVSKEIGQMKDATQRQAKIETMRAVGERITALDEELRGVDSRLDAVMAIIPNIPDPHTPLGKDEHDNLVIRTAGQPRQYPFEPKAH